MNIGSFSSLVQNNAEQISKYVETISVLTYTFNLLLNGKKVIKSA